MERFVPEHVPPSHHGHVVRVCGQTRVLPGPILSGNPYHIASGPMWYVSADRRSWRASCLSVNTYLSPSCGTCLRTNAEFRGAVCPETRTTRSFGSCGTGSWTDEGAIWAHSVRKHVPHRLRAHVVRDCGQTELAGELFVRKHVPLPPMWYVFWDKRRRERSLSTNTYLSPLCGTCLRTDAEFR